MTDTETGSRRENRTAGAGVTAERTRALIAAISLDRTRPLSRAEELEQIVGEADQGPLTDHLTISAQREAAEAAHLLRLSEHGFHDALAARVDQAALGRVELRAHVARWGGGAALPAPGGRAAVD